MRQQVRLDFTELKAGCHTAILREWPSCRRERIVLLRQKTISITMRRVGRQVRDEFVELAGYHRKHAIRVLRRELQLPKVKPGAL